MHDTLLSLQREIESKMCLTGRQHKLWFLSKKRKVSQTGSVSSLWQKTSDVSLFLFQQQRKLDLLTITNPGECAYFGLCACVFVVHSTAHHTTTLNTYTGLHRQDCLFTWVGCEGFVTSLILTTSISCTPRAKICKKRPFPVTCQHFRNPVVAPQACLSQSSGYSLRFCVSMGSWMFCQCIWVKAETAFRALGETDGVARKDAAPICLKYLAALIHFD